VRVGENMLEPNKRKKNVVVVGKKHLIVNKVYFHILYESSFAWLEGRGGGSAPCRCH